MGFLGRVPEQKGLMAEGTHAKQKMVAFILKLHTELALQQPVCLHRK